MTDKPTGVGLGLPISRRIIAHFSKRLWGDSIAGEGVTFHFYLPYVQADVLTENAPV
jgi:signal transduction histidine kinase